MKLGAPRVSSTFMVDAIFSLKLMQSHRLLGRCLWFKGDCLNVNWEGLLPIRGEVIVIEDDPTLLSLMTDIMDEIGAKTVPFATADDALTYLLEAHSECALVVADHGVPGQVQGIEFIEMVTGRWPHIAAILTSGYLIEASAIPAQTVYLHKPWSLDEMVVAVAELLQPGNPISKR